MHVAPWPEDENPWKIEGKSIVFANDWFKVERFETINPAGAPAHYSVIRIRRRAVGVLPIDAQGRVHMVGQWRFPLGRYSWEMPEGGAEDGEDLELCARRELAEETGLSAGRIEKILQMDLSNSLTDETATLFLATDLAPGQAAPEEVEVLSTRTAPFSEVLARVVNGEITDAMTVAAVLRAHHMARTGALPDALARAMLA